DHLLRLHIFLLHVIRASEKQIWESLVRRCRCNSFEYFDCRTHVIDDEQALDDIQLNPNISRRHFFSSLQKNQTGFGTIQKKINRSGSDQRRDVIRRQPDGGAIGSQSHFELAFAVISDTLSIALACNVRSSSIEPSVFIFNTGISGEILAIEQWMQNY